MKNKIPKHIIDLVEGYFEKSRRDYLKVKSYNNEFIDTLLNIEIRKCDMHGIVIEVNDIALSWFCKSGQEKIYAEIEEWLK